MESTVIELTEQLDKINDVVDAAIEWADTKVEECKSRYGQLIGWDIDLYCAVNQLVSPPIQAPPLSPSGEPSAAKKLTVKLERSKKIVEEAKAWTESAETRFKRSRVLQVPLISAGIDLCLAVKALKKELNCP